jgi:hypothetical protein
LNREEALQEMVQLAYLHPGLSLYPGIQLQKRINKPGKYRQ